MWHLEFGPINDALKNMVDGFDVIRNKCQNDRKKTLARRRQNRNEDQAGPGTNLGNQEQPTENNPNSPRHNPRRRLHF